MPIIRSVKKMQEISEKLKKEDKSIGFVPTMGYLHQGHASLLKASRQENAVSVLSIFVNPKQFGKNEDFSKYPRDFKKDELLAKKEKVDIIFYPSADDMYSTRHLTNLTVEGISKILCGKFRPEHFQGVTTIVAKLLNIVNPDIMYLGQKDAQQAIVIKRMVEDLNFPTRIKVLPTVRESDGLAISSRNAYLNSRQRQAAPILYQALSQAKTAILQGERNPQRVKGLLRSLIQKNSISHTDYIECVAADSLGSLKRLEGTVLITLAAWFGKARLIDNIVVKIP